MQDKAQEKDKITFANIVWLFIFGCLLGFILESIWYFIKHGVWINKQGLLYGPFKPIYGFGLVLIVIFMHNFKDKSFVFKFCLGTLIGSAFEYFGSLFQEVVFGTSTWSYASFNLNLGGRIYLPYCLAWGIIAVVCINLLYPAFKKMGAKVPKKLGTILTVIATVFIIIDIILTVWATIRYSQRANNIEAETPLARVVDKWYPDEYMQKKFPKMQIVKK